jgi:hypothetical protein
MDDLIKYLDQAAKIPGALPAVAALAGLVGSVAGAIGTLVGVVLVSCSGNSQTKALDAGKDVIG